MVFVKFMSSVSYAASKNAVKQLVCFLLRKLKASWSPERESNVKRNEWVPEFADNWSSNSSVVLSYWNERHVILVITDDSYFHLGCLGYMHMNLTKAETLNKGIIALLFLNSRGPCMVGVGVLWIWNVSLCCSSEPFFFFNWWPSQICNFFF